MYDPFWQSLFTQSVVACERQDGTTNNLLRQRSSRWMGWMGESDLILRIGNTSWYPSSHNHYDYGRKGKPSILTTNQPTSCWILDSSCLVSTLPPTWFSGKWVYLQYDRFLSFRVYIYIYNFPLYPNKLSFCLHLAGNWFEGFPDHNQGSKGSWQRLKDPGKIT